MENSPLRFLDYDVSLMLSDQVTVSQEEEARKFHSNNFENSNIVHLNRYHHYFISKIFDEIGHLLDHSFYTARHEKGMSLFGGSAVKTIKLDYDSYSLDFAKKNPSKFSAGIPLCFWCDSLFRSVNLIQPVKQTVTCYP